MSRIKEIIIPIIIAKIEHSEEMNNVCLNDLETFSATKVGITSKAETRRIPTALILTTTTMAIRMLNKRFANFVFFLFNWASSSLKVRWNISW